MGLGSKVNLVYWLAGWVIRSDVFGKKANVRIAGQRICSPIIHHDRVTRKLKALK